MRAKLDRRQLLVRLSRGISRRITINFTLIQNFKLYAIVYIKKNYVHFTSGCDYPA